MNVILSKILGGSNIRTDTVIGTCINYPEVGKVFECIAPPIVENSRARVISTSEIQKIEYVDDKYIIHTLNSIYELDIS